MSIYHIYENLAVRSLGVADDVLRVDVNGHTYGYKSNVLASSELERKFLAISRYSVGKALVWLKKNSVLVSGGKELDWTLPGLETAVSAVVRGNPVREVAKALLGGHLSEDLVGTICALNSWWKSNVGRGVLDVLSQWKKETNLLRKQDNLNFDPTKTPAQQNTASKKTDVLKQSCYLRRDAASMLVFENAKDIRKDYPELMTRYSKVMLAVNDANLYDHVVAVDFEKELGLVYLFLDEDAPAETISQLYDAIRNIAAESRIVAKPSDVVLDSVPVDETPARFWFFIVSEAPLPQFDFTVPVPEIAPTPEGDVQTDGAVEVQPKGSDVQISGNVEIVKG